MTGDHDQAGQCRATPMPGLLSRSWFDAGLLDELMAKVDSGGLQLTGEGRFLPEMIKGHL
jgi:hypothetical protein